MARELRVIRRGYIPFPKNVLEPRTKVTIDNVDVTTVSDLRGWNTVRRATLGIGSFTLSLLNNRGKYIDKFRIGSTVRIYQDYNPNPGTTFTATTLRFTGRVDSFNYKEDDEGWIMDITGRDWPQVVDFKFSISFDGIDASAAIISTVTKLNSFYGATIFTVTNVESNSTLIYATYENQSLMSIIKDICDRVDMDCFIDATGDFHSFDRDSKDDYENYAFVGVNVKKVNSFGQDGTQSYNYVKAKSSENSINYVWLSQDASNQSSTWLKGGEFTDSSVSNLQELKDRAGVIKNRSILTETFSGSLVVIGNYDLKPGYSIPCRVPYVKINGMMSSATLTDDYNVSQGYITTIQLNEVAKNQARIFTQLLKDINNLTKLENPNNMEYSFLMKFDDTTEVLTLPTGMSITNGELVMNAAIDTIIIYSIIFILPENITSAELLIEGEQLSASTYRISFDNGVNFQTITPGSNNYIVETGANIGKNGQLEITAISNTYNTNPKWKTIIVRCK